MTVKHLRTEVKELRNTLENLLNTTKNKDWDRLTINEYGSPVRFGQGTVYFNFSSDNWNNERTVSNALKSELVEVHNIMNKNIEQLEQMNEVETVDQELEDYIKQVEQLNNDHVVALEMNVEYDADKLAHYNRYVGYFYEEAMQMNVDFDALEMSEVCENSDQEIEVAYIKSFDNSDITFKTFEYLKKLSTEVEHIGLLDNGLTCMCIWLNDLSVTVYVKLPQEQEVCDDNLNRYVEVKDNGQRVWNKREHVCEISEQEQPTFKELSNEIKSVYGIVLVDEFEELLIEFMDVVDKVEIKTTMGNRVLYKLLDGKGSYVNVWVRPIHIKEKKVLITISKDKFTVSTKVLGEQGINGSHSIDKLNSIVDELIASGWVGDVINRTGIVLDTKLNKRYFREVV